MYMSQMTRIDLYDWVIHNGCEQIVLPENKARVIKFVNPKNGGGGYLELPIDNRGVKDYVVYRICISLGIEIPTHASYFNGREGKGK